MPPPNHRPAIVWFRDDLRIADNRALSAAAATGRPVVPIYIHDEESDGLRPLGGASRWWLHHSLDALSRDLTTFGLRLAILRGSAATAVPKLVEEIGAAAVFWSRRYGASERVVDTRIKSALTEAGVETESHNDHLLVEPWDMQTMAGEPFKVFTPFWRALNGRGGVETPIAKPKQIAGTRMQIAGSVALEDLGLLPTKPDWAGGLRDAWTPGEAGAHERLTNFLRSGLRGYAEERDRPGRDATSALSPHLRFGEISPRQVWDAARNAAHSGGAQLGDVEKFLSELAWREFSYHLLFHNPDLATRNYQPRFDAFPWRSDAKGLQVWQRGRTGIPIVDAGMRQLWHTGWMHNRVRMIAASFLSKHLLIDWRAGENWFWDTLVDADPANNPASWQWIAGSGADAAPYFRVFNPVLQGEKFDPDGAYVSRWVPELAKLSIPYIHKPWTAPEAALDAAGITLGNDYPRPMVDLPEGRARALAAFRQMK